MFRAGADDAVYRDTDRRFTTEIIELQMTQHKLITVLPVQFNNSPCFQFPIFPDKFRHFFTKEKISGLLRVHTVNTLNPAELHTLQ